MATWHQARARKRHPVPLYHPTLWTVLINPPSGLAASLLFPTRAQAEAYIARAYPTPRASAVLLLRPANPQEPT